MMHFAKAFGVVKVKRSRWGPKVNDQFPVDAVSLTRVVKNRPFIGPDEVLIEIELEFPKGFFDQHTPKATVTFPDPPPQQVWANGEVAEPLEPALDPVQDVIET